MLVAFIGSPIVAATDLAASLLVFVGGIAVAAVAVLNPAGASAHDRAIQRAVAKNITGADPL